MSTVNGKKDPLDKILKKIPPEANKEKIKEIYFSDGLINKRIKLVDFFIQEINEERDEIKKRVFILERIKNEPDGLLKYLLELSVALDSDNQAWAKKIAKKIINTGPEEPFFFRSIEFPDFHNQLKSTIKSFLIKVKYRLKDKMIKKMMINQMVNLAPTENLEEVLPFWSADWTLADMRNFLNSRNYGKPFIGFWFLELISSTHEAEVMRFLKEVLDQEVVKKYGKSFAWLLAMHPSKSLSSEIIKIFKELWESEVSYNRYLVLEFLEYSQLKEQMVKEVPELSKPLFQLKRTLFLGMLKRGENLNFSIYQLLKLGDRSEELLWWVTFFEK